MIVFNETERAKGTSNWDFYSSHINLQYELVELVPNGYNKLYAAILNKDTMEIKAAVISQQFTSKGTKVAFTMMNEDVGILDVLPERILVRLTASDSPIVNSLRKSSIEYWNVFRSVPKLEKDDIIVYKENGKIKRSIKVNPEIANTYKYEIANERIAEVEIFRGGKLIFVSSQAKDGKLTKKFDIDFARYNWRDVTGKHKYAEFGVLINYMKDNKMIDDVKVKSYGGRYLIYKQKNTYTISDKHNSCYKMNGKYVRGYPHYVLNKKGINFINRIVLYNTLCS